MIRKVVVFSTPRRVELREEELDAPAPDEVVVDTAVSGISAGTELLFYRGSVPGQLQTTTTESTRSLTVSNENELIISFYREAIDLYGLVINSNLQRSPPTGDAFGFFRAGHTVVQILDANIWYHSDGDLPDSMYPSGLERATRLYAYVLNRLDQTSRAELE